MMDKVTGGLTVRDWLQERHDNCLRISKNKTGVDKAGWLVDAAYFRAAVSALDAAEKLVGENELYLSAIAADFPDTPSARAALSKEKG